MSKDIISARADVLILGSGPAGWTAAIYAARASLQTVLFTGLARGGLPGGQLMLTTEVENFPGFEEGILGPALMERMKRQALRFGVTAIEADVTRVELAQPPFAAFVATSDGETRFEGRSVIVATGASPRWLGLPSEARLRGRGVSSCATCDGFFFRGEHVGVVGGGDTALEEALYLARHAASVTVIHRRGELRASKIMQERARAHPALHWALHKEVVEVLGDQRVEGVRLRDTRTGEQSLLPLTGLFIAIGHRPNTELFHG
ncbi:MAG: thioredoxin-disulfide reductase, partial [Chloroflexota bacterium]